MPHDIKKHTSLVVFRGAKDYLLAGIFLSDLAKGWGKHQHIPNSS
jgi:hypothetical protein